MMVGEVILLGVLALAVMVAVLAVAVQWALGGVGT